MLFRLSAPLAKGAVDGVAAPDDPMRTLKLGGFALALVVGWVFILWANNFHVTAPVVMVCLAYLCVVALILNLWRTGAAAVAPDDANDAWGRPIGAKGELEKEKKTLLKAIKEAEFDLAMGKLSKRDSDSLIKQYRARAIEVIKELDRVGDGAALSAREQIEREVKARRELAAQDKPSKRAKNVAEKRAKAAEAKVEAKAEAKAEPNVEVVEAKIEPEPESAAPEPAVTPAEPAAAFADIVELSLDDIDAAKALFATRDDVGPIESIDGGVSIAVADGSNVAALFAACEHAGIKISRISVRRAGESP
ncbi:MAG TPA: hypothetical protein VGG74_36575 [Kofleriaceae bacterium]